MNHGWVVAGKSKTNLQDSDRYAVLWTNLEWKILEGKKCEKWDIFHSFLFITAWYASQMSTTTSPLPPQKK